MREREREREREIAYMNMNINLRMLDEYVLTIDHVRGGIKYNVRV